MNFRKLTLEAKKLQQTYETFMQTAEGDFTFTYQMLTGLDGLWVFRGNFASESATSQALLIDHRSACASLISLKDEEEILNPIEIIKVLYSEEELNEVDSLLEKYDDNEIEKETYKLLWESCKNVKGVEEFRALPLVNKEVVWDLLHNGFRRTFDTDFNLQFGFQWANAYKEIRPNPSAGAIKNQISKLQKAVDEKNQKLAEAPPAILAVAAVPVSEEVLPLEPIEKNDEPTETSGS